MTDRNALVGSILAAAGIVVAGIGIGCNHLSRDMDVLHGGLQELRADVREIRGLLVDHLDEHPTDND